MCIATQTSCWERRRNTRRSARISTLRSQNWLASRRHRRTARRFTHLLSSANQRPDDSSITHRSAAYVLSFRLVLVSQTCFFDVRSVACFAHRLQTGVRSNVCRCKAWAVSLSKHKNSIKIIQYLTRTLLVSVMLCLSRRYPVQTVCPDCALDINGKMSPDVLLLFCTAIRVVQWIIVKLC